VSGRPPALVVLAGPNGAGKSTAAPILIRDTLGIKDFVNADVIARGLSGFAPETAALAAGRVMLTRLHQLAARRVDFAFETTLAGRSYAPWIAQAKADGYEFHLVYLWVPSAETSIGRIAERVAHGGHDVDDETVRRRYRSSMANFHLLYRPLADTWKLYDNSEGTIPRLVAWGESSDEHISDRLVWRASLRDAGVG
jgi:predicted ABC-type ATPase